MHAYLDCLVVFSWSAYDNYGVLLRQRPESVGPLFAASCHTNSGREKSFYDLILGCLQFAHDNSCCQVFLKLFKMH